jgi:predicted glycosyltransferase
LKIWFDADNGPHVLIMRPLVAELTRRGHEILFTARDRTSTCELLDLYGFTYRKVGAEYGNGMSGKVAGTLGRAWALMRAMKGEKPTVSFGHGSRALPIASRLIGVPTVTMYDYEWVDPRLFNWFCRSILLPKAITSDRCADADIATNKVVSYPGFKEELYLGGREFDTTIAAGLGLREEAVKVLLRPPATTAHYHNPEAEVILGAILKKLASVDNVQLVFLPRTHDQLALPKEAGVSEVIVPDKVYDGPSLVATMDMVISGGGTMTREAAIMGVPSYSFFRGKSGMVDEALAAAGQLTLIGDPTQVSGHLLVEQKKGTATQPDPGPLVDFICSAIEKAAGPQG